MKKMATYIVFAALLALAGPLNAQVKRNLEIPNPEAPVTFINLMEIPAQDIERFVADWNESSKIMGQMPGFITATLYRSLVAEAKYQLVTVGQWQSYDAWLAANNDPAYAQRLSEDIGHTAEIKLTRGFYRPAAWSANTYTDVPSGGNKQPPLDNQPSLERGPNNPEILSPESPFVFINLMEMKAEDISPFVLDWRVRSKIMGQMPAAMSSTLYRSLLADNAFQIINVSQWQSYNGFIAAVNDSRYARELGSDLKHVPSIKLTRGFYRPVAQYVHIYSDVPGLKTDEVSSRP